MLNKFYFIIIFIVCGTQLLFAQKDTLYVFGPGGPFPPIEELSKTFETRYYVKVILTKGPFKNWQDEAQNKADVIYSGSEHMMTDFENALPNQIIAKSVYPLYRRNSGLIVRKGNPKKIRKIEDLEKDGLSIMIVNGSGLTGVWEDMLSNIDDMETFRAIRNNISVFAQNSGIAEKKWTEQKDIDVWITWDIWQFRNQETADLIKLKNKFTI